jgi:hypothetical protein
MHSTSYAGYLFAFMWDWQKKRFVTVGCNILLVLILFFKFHFTHFHYIFLLWLMITFTVQLPLLSEHCFSNFVLNQFHYIVSCDCELWLVEWFNFSCCQNTFCNKCVMKVKVLFWITLFMCYIYRVSFLNKVMKCKSWGSHSTVVEIQWFWAMMSYHLIVTDVSEELPALFLDWINHEWVGSKLLWNVGNFYQLTWCHIPGGINLKGNESLDSISSTSATITFTGGTSLYGVSLNRFDNPKIILQFRNLVRGIR